MPLDLFDKWELYHRHYGEHDDFHWIKLFNLLAGKNGEPYLHSVYLVEEEKPPISADAVKAMLNKPQTKKVDK